MSKLHPNKIYNSVFSIRFFQKKITKKFIAYFLVGFLVISSITLPGTIFNHSRVLAANSSNKTEANLSNPNDDKVGICIPGLCIKTPPILKPLEKPIQDGINSIVRDKLRSFLSNEIPITGTEHKLYPTTSQLPGGQFTPQILYLNAVNSSQVIPPGDYEVPVHYYCTKVYTLNGAGNRYRLARLNGRMSNVLSTLYQRASLNKVPIQDVQVLSWSIQSGVSYDNLSSSSKQLVNQLIPDYRQQLEGSFTDKTIKYWNSISQITSLPSFDATLNELGDIGTFARSLLRAREEIINTNFNYRSLANAFVISQDVNLPGGMETTPWSQINEQVYLRFLAPKGALNDGVAQVRILGRSQTKELDKVDLLKSNVESKQVISSLPGNNNRSASSVTAEALLSHISQSVGIPEQNGQALTATVTPAPEGTVATIRSSQTSAPPCKDGILGNPNEKIFSDLDGVVGSRTKLRVFKFRFCPEKSITSGTEFLGTELLPETKQLLQFELSFEISYEVLTSKAANILNSRSDRLYNIINSLIGYGLAITKFPVLQSAGFGLVTGVAIPELQQPHTWSPSDKFTHKYKAIYDNQTRKTKITESFKLEGEEVILQRSRKVKRNRVYINKTINYTQDGIPFDTMGD